MGFSLLLLSFVVFASSIVAFPRIALENVARAPEASQFSLSIRSSPPSQGAGALPPVPPPFDAEAQSVSTTGEHAFVAPGPNDARGMCPGLNALANHGYLPHNGIATVTQFFEATQKAFGMGPDLALFLAVYGAVLDGGLTYWSIGGTPHVGIGGSHNNYESDSSPLKSDLYQYGSNGMMVMSQFYELYNMQPDATTANYNLEVLRTFRKTRFNESIQKNPVFYFGPFAGNIVAQAAYIFIYRFMSNKSEEHPEGVLNKDVLKTFMSIQGPEDDLKWVPGHERIPDNFYKRNVLDEYGIAYLDSDILYFALEEPDILLPGCNNGKVNAYDKIDPSVISRNAYSLEQATKHPICFSLEFLRAELPGLTGLTSSLLSPLFGALNNLTSTLDCAAIGSVNTSSLGVCPGFGLYGGPTAKIAAGAIQT